MTSSENEEKYGKKIEYDPLWKGPMENFRNPTDRIWLIVFSIYIFIYIVCATYGLVTGDMHKFTNPDDSTGRTCGVDLDVKNNSFLIPVDLNSCAGFSRCSATVCVKQCPTEDFIYDRNSRDPNYLESIREKLICTPDISVPTILSLQQLDILISKQKCSELYLKSSPLLGRCFSTGDYDELSSEIKRRINEKDFNDAKRAFLETQNFMQETLHNFKAAFVPAITVSILCGIVALGYVVLLKWFAKQFFHGSVLLTFALMIFGIYKLSVTYARSNGGQDVTLFGLIALVAILILMVIFVIYFRKKIYLACQLIKESSKAVLHLWSTLIFPILPWILYVFILVFFLLVLGHISSIEKYDYKIEKLNFEGQNDSCKCGNSNGVPYLDGEVCDPVTFSNECKANGKPCLFVYCNLNTKSTPGFVFFLHAVNTFGLYWFMYFVAGFQYMVLSGAFARWYWTYNKNNVDNGALFQSASRTVRFHMGTIAIGSLILAIVQVIRNILDSINQRLREAKNPIAMPFMCCFRVFFDLMEAFINYLNYNAYLMCAVHGKNFMHSAKSAFNLLMRNIVNIIVVDNVVDWILEFAKLLITGIGVLCVYLHYFLTTDGQTRSLGIDESFTALVLTAIFTYAIASVFFSVQNVAVKTLFLCFLEDSERNDGSEEKPYFMSDKLKGLLNK